MDRFLAIDIETTGLDESYCQILEFSCVVGNFNSSVDVELLPSFTRRFYYDKIVGEPLALAMNAQLIDDMYGRRGPYPWMSIDGLISEFNDFLLNEQVDGFRYESGTFGRIGKSTIAGKNFSTFDLRFLRKLPRWNNLGLHRRVLDVGILLFLPTSDDAVPDLATCANRLNVPFDAKHSSLADCRCVVSCLREYYKY